MKTALVVALTAMLTVPAGAVPLLAYAKKGARSKPVSAAPKKEKPVAAPAPVEGVLPPLMSEDPYNLFHLMAQPEVLRDAPNTPKPARRPAPAVSPAPKK